MWKGAVSFGLVNVPVRMYTATSSHDVSFHQVHRSDGGRIKYKRTCDACGEEVGFDEIAKGYESPDGQLVILTDDDLADLPVTASREIEVERFGVRNRSLYDAHMDSVRISVWYFPIVELAGIVGTADDRCGRGAAPGPGRRRQPEHDRRHPPPTRVGRQQDLTPCSVLGDDRPHDPTGRLLPYGRAILVTGLITGWREVALPALMIP